MLYFSPKFYYSSFGACRSLTGKKSEGHRVKISIAIGTLALVSSFALADTIQENGGSPTFVNVPANLTTGLGTGVPYWDNVSGDGVNKNIGYFLTASGGFTGGTQYSPNQYLAASSGSPDAPASFNLVHTTNSLILSLIGVTTGNTTDVFGLYDASKTGAQAIASEVAVYGPGTLTVGTTSTKNALGFTSIGFYLTDSAGATWFSNASQNVNGSTGEAAGHQHFSIFTTGTDPNTFYVGVEDWITNSGEGVNGDYNDIVIKINADAVPEPATFGMLGAGLLALGVARYRTRKSRA